MVRALFVFIFLFSSISYAEKASKAEMNKNLKSSYDRVVSLEQFISEYYSAASPKDLKSINKIFSGYDFENKPDMTIVKNIITLKKNDKSVEIEINTDDGTVIYLNEYRVNLDNSDPF